MTSRSRVSARRPFPTRGGVSRRRLLSAGWCLAAIPSLVAQQVENGAVNDLVVHEWGTFTSFQGSDGGGLEGLHHEEERLPEFVHDLGRLVVAPGGGASRRALKFPASRVTQKMETPVIYFHTDRPQRVAVDVSYDRGLLTQFYPIPDVVGPPLPELQRLAARGAVDLRDLKRSFLRWEVDLVPYASDPPAEIPDVDSSDPWAEARRVRAAYVRTIEREGVQRRTEAEHYLFYRGLGRVDLPVAVRADAGDRGAFVNASEHAVPFAVVLEVDPARGGRFTELGGLPGARAGVDSVRDFALADVAFEADLDRVVGALSATVMAALVDHGLFLDEARAMVATWSRSWFRSPGQRVIYLVPDPIVARLLVLRVRPKPREIVRALVGRLEYATPEQERATERALLDRASPDPVARARAAAHLQRLDRFLEPHLRRALEAGASRAVRDAAAELLDGL